MKFRPRFTFLLLSLATATPLRAGTGIVDLTTLANYAAQPIPAYINRSNTPANNPITDKGATLGRILFYDKRLSRTDTISCASCHRQSRAFADSAVASTGVAGTTGRHSMRLVNARFGTEPRFFWNERAATLETQTSQPIQDHIEMGFSGTAGDPAFAALVTKLTAIAEYRVLFALVFGDSTITETRVQLALAQFVRSIQSFDSRYDAGRAAAGNDGARFANFTDSENDGKALFLAPPGNGGAGCAGCHRPPEFDIDPNSRNNGIIGAIGGGTDLTNTRSPSLRDLVGPNLTPNGPFMHTGVFDNLGQVVAHYNRLPQDNANLDPRLRRPGGQVQNLGLNATQQSDIVNFLRTLTGSNLYTDAKWSDPFDANGALSLIVLPPEAVSLAANGDGTATLSCRGVAGLQFQLRTSTDLVSWTPVALVTPNSAGICTANVPITTGVFYRFTYEPPAASAPALAAAPVPVVSLATTRTTATTTTTGSRTLKSVSPLRRLPAPRATKR